MTHDLTLHATRRQCLRSAVALAAAATLPLARTARAADTPAAVRLVLPHAAGSGVDAIARAMQNALGKALGASIVVDNQPGAGGIVGLQQLARATPDGHTLSLVSNNVVIFPSVYKSLPFQMPGDFTPVAVCGTTPMVLVVHPRWQVTDAQGFLALLKARPTDLTYGSGGNGTILHLAAELLLDETGTKARHIPYKGVGPMVSDLVGGQIDFAVVALPTAQPHLRSGALRAIGLTTAERVPAAKEIPTFAEQGLPAYVVDAWFAMLGPKGLPAPVVQRLHGALAATFASPEVKEMMDRQGNVIRLGTPEQAGPFLRSELDKYAAIVRKANVRLD
ncbi:MAG: Bug family tripartite tricarboxylate transporter substrate binding protein [Aquincola tertiaricarbonis]|uniref:Bug family tripartite tricarboxylate transporter substrate binding protein n=1 Tax=Aquincola sp. J276 TaxID=2898432 RepID=UPI0021510F27|nr:tripartite tricarboxylate transporter substrate binding protein [Aquincola sp. J276]MCR5867713.1 tripartite tricarboxylate transporter substrate binding protein [Aquincola sp. J276]